MSTIKKIEIRNFKKFDRYSVSCSNLNVLTGPNNAGKSTILDALRITADVLKYSSYRRATPINCNGEVVFGFEMDSALFGIDIQSIQKDYSDNQAEIKVTIENGVSLLIEISADDRVKAYLVGSASHPQTIAQFRKLFPLDLVVVPTLGPVEIDEFHVLDKTVRNTESTRSAHRHFRNIVDRLSEENFINFKESVESAWPGIKIEKPILEGFSRVITMSFLEKRIPREIGKSGFGFQVWMQMMLHLQRGGSRSVLVLDEPDIYLHPTLQKRLVRNVTKKFAQSFIATHSTEIINEASSSNI